MEYSLRSFVCVILCRNCRWTITSRARESLRCRTRYQRLYGDIGYGRWGRVRFSLARLFFHFSFRFSFFFFFAFRDDKLWHLRTEEEKFPESNVGHPMPFSLSIAGPHVHIGYSVPGNGSWYFSLREFHFISFYFFSFFVQQ